MKRRRFQREDWLDLALQELSANGMEALKLEAICATAGLTRGSFYHHFADHAEFLLAVASHWAERQTDTLLAAIDQSASPDEISDQLNHLAVEIDYRLELGIRELARRMSDVSAIVERTDEIRLDFMAGLYKRRFELEDKAAALAAALEYAAFNGKILIDPDIGRDERLALANLFDRMVVCFFSKD